MILFLPEHYQNVHVLKHNDKPMTTITDFDGVKRFQWVLKPPSTSRQRNKSKQTNAAMS